jgi:hypothetical protein
MWAQSSLLQDDLSVVTWVGGDGQSWPLSGGMSPIPPSVGVVLTGGVKGLHAPFVHIDQQGAHQDGVDNIGTAYNAAEMDFDLTAFGNSPAELRRVWRQWLSGWDPETPGRLTWFTTDLGEWWRDLRFLQEPRDAIALGGVSSQKISWAARADFPFWVSFDSTSRFDPPTGSSQDFLPLTNRGDRKGWPRYIIQGPGTITLNDNGSSARQISIPLHAGEVVLITTLPNRRTVKELNTGANLYPRLVGRFSTPVPAAKAGKPQEVHVSVTVTGAVAGQTSIVASLTPWRRWPE